MTRSMPNTQALQAQADKIAKLQAQAKADLKSKDKFHAQDGVSDAVNADLRDKWQRKQDLSVALDNLDKRIVDFDDGRNNYQEGATGSEPVYKDLRNRVGANIEGDLNQIIGELAKL